MNGHNYSASALSFGELLYDARVRRGFTQRDVARRAGIDVRSYQRIEKGRGATLTTALRLAMAIHINLMEVILEEDNYE